MSIFSGTAPDKAASADVVEEISIPLYIGGLIVLLSGIGAVAQHLRAPAFTQFTVLVTIVGVTVSYFLRRLGVPARWIGIGAVVLGIVFLFALQGAGPFGNIVPEEAQSSQDMLIASALALTATFYSFLLITDDVVVFTCVFSIALIGLTGTVDVNFTLIGAFLIFLAAAIFLLVHQNYLQHRPRNTTTSTEARLRLLRTQVLMTLLCGVTATVLGILIAVPIQMVGRNVSLAGIIHRLSVPAGSGMPTRGRRVLVFDDRNRFDVGLGPVGDDQTEVMTVTGEKPFYWRGRTYEYYTGNGWESQLSGEARPLAGNPVGNNIYEFDLSLVDSAAPRRQLKRYTHRFKPKGGTVGVLHAPVEPRRIRIPSAGIAYRPDNTAWVPVFYRPVRVDGYDVESEVTEWPNEQQRESDLRRSGTRYPRAITMRYLGSDHELENAELQKLATEATAGVSDPYSKAEAIRQFVAGRCIYTLEAPAVPSNRDAAEFFLNVSQEGYCDLYATAVAVLCRYAGLPVRVATGFIPGTPSLNNPKQYVLRGIDRHAWAEVYFTGYGWIPFDATSVTGAAGAPEAPTVQVERTSWQKLIGRGPLPLLLAGLGSLALLFAVATEIHGRWKRRLAGDSRDAADEVAAIYLQTARLIGRRGVDRAPQITPGAYAARVRAFLGPETGDALSGLTHLAERALYGPETVTAQDVESARLSAAQVRAALKQVGKAPHGREAPAS